MARAAEKNACSAQRRKGPTEAVEGEFIPFALPDLDQSELDAVAETLRSGWITTGSKAHRFEFEFADFVGASYALAVNSCTGALHLALEAMGVGEGDEVITTPYTFTATASTVEHLRARPVLVDVESDTLNIDPDALEAAIGPRTKVILPVHFAGHPANLDRIYEIASRRGLAVLEDCAHALPSAFFGRRVGADLDRTRYPGITHHATCFSFYATKSLTTGEGGMLCTDRHDLAARARLMSLHGMTSDAWKRHTAAGNWYYEVVAPGFKYNMGDIAAALGLVQLSKVERMKERRRQIAGTYDRAFSARPELQSPVERPGCEHSWHVYALRLHLERLGIDRGRFIQELKARGIGSSVHFIPLHLHPYYREKYGYVDTDLPIAAREYRREVSLPIYSAMTDHDVTRVAEAVTGIAAEYRTRSDKVRLMSIAHAKADLGRSSV